ILICDLASEHLQYLSSKNKVTTDEFQERFRKILRARSALGAKEEEYQVPPPASPDQGHLSNRLGVGVGVHRGRLFEEVAIRPAYHDLLDNGRGYVEGAQIIFGEAAFRHYPSDRKFVFQKLDFIDIVSLAPRDTFFQPVSWKVKTGLLHKTGNDGQDHLVYELNPGGGFSYALNRRNLVYVMGEADFNTGGGIEERYAMGVGASAGLLGSLTDFWNVHLYAREMYYGIGGEHNELEAGLHQNFTLSRNTAIRAELTVRRAYDFTRVSAGLYWNLFF
ncbi:MAG TPA: hypothetical protein VLS90_12105, partial [Thermodesulfobacteriota bacterium]|nr:hypothetical protein [Thermodesulfobacteriota bacterium]